MVCKQQPPWKPKFPFSYTPVFTAEQGITGHAVFLWTTWVSCLSCVSSLILAYLKPMHQGKGRLGK